MHDVDVTKAMIWKRSSFGAGDGGNIAIRAWSRCFVGVSGSLLILRYCEAEL
jgi:hypothetical protein